MKKTPPALNWLAEKRARVLHRLLEAERLVSAVSEKRERLLRRLAPGERRAAEAQRRAEQARLELDSLDRTLVMFSSAIHPDSIDPVNGWKGRYGRLGALRNNLLSRLRASYPAYLSTHELALALAAQFASEQSTWECRPDWPRVVQSTLRKLVASGAVERGHILNVGLITMGQWRARGPTRHVTLAALQSQSNIDTSPDQP